MIETQNLKLILQNRKDLIDKIISQLDSTDQSFKVNELDELFSVLYPLNRRFENEILDAIESLSNKISSQRFTCLFSQESEEMIHMLVSGSTKPEAQKIKRQNGLKGIRDFTREATELLIIDPYIFSGGKSKSKAYIEEFKRSSRIDNSSVKRIHIIYCSKYDNRAIKTGIKKIAQQNNCTITSFDTDKIHDRIWIKNQSEAIVVGTSFNGLGDRLSFILELPKYDMYELLDYLKTEKMLTSTFS